MKNRYLLFKKSALLISGIILLLNCTKTDSLKNDIVERYRGLIKSVKDSVLVAAQDTSIINPILDKLLAEYDWKKEQQNWQRNPFLSEKIEQPPPMVVTPKKVVRRKAENLSLTGIIQTENNRKALINGRLYENGETIKNMKILKIGKKYVILKNPNKTVRLILNKK